MSSRRTTIVREVVAATVLAAPSAVAAQEPPYLSGYVMDEAALLSPDAATRLEARLSGFARETGSQVVVLTVPSLDGRPIEDFALERAEDWQLGREAQDDGVLFVVAEAERRMRIEVGYGLEGALTDAGSRRILDNVVAPRFRAGDYDGGVEAGVERILGAITGEVPPPEEGPASTDEPGLGPVLFQLALLVIFVMMLRAARRRDRGRGWSSKNGWRPYGHVILPPPRGSGGRGGWFGGGGGGFSGGGGGFGGGGASGGW